MNIKITQVKSGIDRPERQKRTLVALGLRKLNASREVEATLQILGMVKKVSHLIKVDTLDAVFNVTVNKSSSVSSVVEKEVVAKAIEIPTITESVPVIIKEVEVVDSVAEEVMPELVAAEVVAELPVDIVVEQEVEEVEPSVTVDEVADLPTGPTEEEGKEQE
jgi:large subunit ribosomal protein L30